MLGHEEALLVQITRQTRCLARQTYWWRLTALASKRHLPNTRKRRAALATVTQLVDEDLERMSVSALGRAHDWTHKLTVAKEVLDRFSSSCDSLLAESKGSTVSELLSRVLSDKNNEPKKGFEWRRSHHQDALVSQAIQCWCGMTGDEAEAIKVGHPDTPGPFLRFLFAVAEPFIEAEWATEYSLHLKALQLLGRRS